MIALCKTCGQSFILSPELKELYLEGEIPIPDMCNDCFYGVPAMIDDPEMYNGPTGHDYICFSDADPGL